MECWELVGKPPPHIGRGRKACNATGKGASQSLGSQEYQYFQRQLYELKVGLSGKNQAHPKLSTLGKVLKHQPATSS